MDKLGRYNQQNNSDNYHPNKQDEIADILRKKIEIMQDDIAVLTKLAKYYYGTTISKNYGKYLQKNTTPEDEYEDDHTILQENLYTLIKYEGKDMLIHIGTGSFPPEIFTRRDILELKGFSHSPLPLFVVTAWAEQEHRETNPKKFLNEQALMYAPKGGQIEMRIHAKQKVHQIDYGRSNGIMNYDDAIVTLQNAEIKKVFHHEKVFMYVVDKIDELKKKSYDEVKIRSNLKEEFLHNLSPEHSLIYKQMKECFLVMSNENHEKMYEMIQSFDVHKKVFTKPHTF